MSWLALLLFFWGLKITAAVKQEITLPLHMLISCSPDRWWCDFPSLPPSYPLSHFLPTLPLSLCLPLIQVPLEKLKERREWREHRLAALVSHKAEMERQENCS